MTFPRTPSVLLTGSYSGDPRASHRPAPTQPTWSRAPRDTHHQPYFAALELRTPFRTHLR